MTVQELIEASARLVDVLGVGQQMSSAHYDSALEDLNSLMDSWSTENLLVFSVTRNTHTLDGSTSYTMGPAGDINTVRPQKIIAVTTLANNVSMDADLFSASQWAQINDYTLSGSYVHRFYCDGASPLSTLYVHPAPSSGTLTIESYKPFTAFGALGETVTLPAGYIEGLKFSLALVLADTYRRPIPPDVLQNSQILKQQIRQHNADRLGIPIPVEAPEAETSQRPGGEA
jgi:hypothetical protein